MFVFDIKIQCHCFNFAF